MKGTPPSLVRLPFPLRSDKGTARDVFLEAESRLRGHGCFGFSEGKAE